MCVDLSLGFLFCSIDLYFCLCASTILSWWLWLCSRARSQVGWFLQFHSSFSGSLWLFQVFCISIQIVKLFVIALWRIPLVAWYGLHWIYRLLWVVYSFSLYWFFRSKRISFLLTYICSSLLRNPDAGQEAKVRIGHGTTDWFKIEKEVQGLCCHPAYLTYMQSTSYEMQGWMNHKLESRLPGEISAQIILVSDMQMLAL